jgi:tetratricopeptide (TPR) repeat protein
VIGEPDDARLPDPGQATTVDGVVERLRSLKLWAGDPSYETIRERVNAGWAAEGRPAGELAGRTTVVDCFRLGRRRLNADLVTAVVRALHPDTGYVAQWRQALQVIGGERRSASQVRVQAALPPDLTGFTGRTALLDRLGGIDDEGGGAVVISAIEGMAGVGKTQLAVHAGHLLVRERRVDRVLFVNLRGFHPDPAQPPADPAAVLDGFLRLLGVPGQQIPHDLDGRTAQYRSLLAGTRTLVVLDNAADAGQVAPLLPRTPRCPALVTSRRSLTGLRPATRLAVGVFTPGEAVALLAATGAETGDDPGAAARIAARCGYLPLALGLISGHIRAKPGWTLTDHADWLDERHRDRRLDDGIELALDLSYRNLPAGRQRLLRLLALHPGQDLDAYAAAALAGTGLEAAGEHLRRLRDDHLLQEGGPGRYAFHDLIRAHATTRAHDEDRPAERRAALTRLYDHYLATAATAMDVLYPADAVRRPEIPPAGSPAPDLGDHDSALGWLDTERPTLVAVATRGGPAHAVALSGVLFRYLDGGHQSDAVTVHRHAREAAAAAGDTGGEAAALTNLGIADWRLGRYGSAAGHLRESLVLFRRAGDPAGQARAQGTLGLLEERAGHYPEAAGHHQQALALFRAAGNGAGEARALSNLGLLEAKLGRYDDAVGHCEQALELFRRAGDRAGEVSALDNLGDVEVRAGRYGPAGEHLRQAVALYRRLGNRSGEAWTLDTLGMLHTRLGEAGRAIAYHEQALEVTRETGDREAEAITLNGLGEAAQVAGRPADVLAHHTAALGIAVAIGASEQQARAHTGLGHAHRALGRPDLARDHDERAAALSTGLAT